MVIVLKDKTAKNLDYVRCMEIAAVHDLAEAIVGDIDHVSIVDGKVSKKEKNELEAKAINKISKDLGNSVGERIKCLWQEYENHETEEAKFVKALDKIECITQLVESGHKTYDRPELIACYADNATKNFLELLPYLKEAKRRLRAEYKKGNHEWKEEYNYGLK